MPELIQEYSARVRTSSGRTYIVRAFGEERDDGTWEGWLEFHPADGKGPILRTGEETSQPNRTAVVYWASGLEPVYFEGALDRAA